MPRPPRADEAGGLYHALNRGNLRAANFHKEMYFLAFERILYESPLLSPCPMPRLPGWTGRVNEPLSEKVLAAVRLSAQRGRPLGDEG